MEATTAYTATVKSRDKAQFTSENLRNQVVDDIVIDAGAIPGLETGDGQPQSWFGRWRGEYYV